MFVIEGMEQERRMRRRKEKREEEEDEAFTLEKVEESREKEENV